MFNLNFNLKPNIHSTLSIIHVDSYKNLGTVEENTILLQTKKFTQNRMEGLSRAGGYIICFKLRKNIAPKNKQSMYGFFFLNSTVV